MLNLFWENLTRQMKVVSLSKKRFINSTINNIDQWILFSFPLNNIRKEIFVFFLKISKVNNFHNKAMPK